jgi:hypothetical protein
VCGNSLVLEGMLLMLIEVLIRVRGLIQVEMPVLEEKHILVEGQLQLVAETLEVVVRTPKGKCMPA